MAEEDGKSRALEPHPFLHPSCLSPELPELMTGSREHRT